MSPINTTTKTFAEQIADLVGKYKSYCTSNALFYWGDGASTGLRIEAPFLAKEFVDNVGPALFKLARYLFYLEVCFFVNGRLCCRGSSDALNTHVCVSYCREEDNREMQELNLPRPRNVCIPLLSAFCTLGFL